MKIIGTDNLAHETVADTLWLDGVLDTEVKLERDRLRTALKQIAYGSGEWIVPPEQIAREALGMVPADEQGAEMEK